MTKAVAPEKFYKPEDSIPMVDVRSESEFSKGHIPGSINIPLLDDKARKEIGTLYKQMGREAAVMKGFQLVGPRFYNLFKQIRRKAGHKQVKMYCWRGGMRSNIMGWMMGLAEYDVTILKGGYKAFRNQMHTLFHLPWKWIVISGKTGVGKTTMLHKLADRGEQVLDFEAMASHKGSAFGHIGLPEQPTVEQFENLIGWQLWQYDESKPVWIENESRFIGQVRIPDALFNQTLDMPVIELMVSEEVRRNLILEEYGRQPVEQLLEATKKLERKLGGDRMKLACEGLLSGDMHAWLDVLLPYYDKTYTHSSSIRNGEVHAFTLSGDHAFDIDGLLQLKEQLWNK